MKPIRRIFAFLSLLILAGLAFRGIFALFSEPRDAKLVVSVLWVLLFGSTVMLETMTKQEKLSVHLARFAGTLLLAGALAMFGTKALMVIWSVGMALTAWQLGTLLRRRAIPAST